jgi:hypothetical protein
MLREGLKVVLAVLALAPGLARASEGEYLIVAEALFLYDPLPPGGRDLNLSLALERVEADPVTGEGGFTALPRVQLALALGKRVGLTADLGIASGGERLLEAPGASLKVLLRSPGRDATGLAASLDVFGAADGFAPAEAALGLGAIRPLGRVALRAAASLATSVSSWSPHLHGGLSAALALGSRWRALAEVVGEVEDGELTLATGPALKLALGERTALMAGALFRMAPAATPLLTIQLTQAM